MFSFPFPDTSHATNRDSPILWSRASSGRIGAKSVLGSAFTDICLCKIGWFLFCFLSFVTVKPADSSFYLVSVICLTVKMAVSFGFCHLPPPIFSPIRCLFIFPSFLATLLPSGSFLSSFVVYFPISVILLMSFSQSATVFYLISSCFFRFLSLMGFPPKSKVGHSLSDSSFSFDLPTPTPTRFALQRYPCVDVILPHHCAWINALHRTEPRCTGPNRAATQLAAFQRTSLRGAANPNYYNPKLW